MLTFCSIVFTDMKNRIIVETHCNESREQAGFLSGARILITLCFESAGGMITKQTVLFDVLEISRKEEVGEAQENNENRAAIKSDRKSEMILWHNDMTQYPQRYSILLEESF